MYLVLQDTQATQKEFLKMFLKIILDLSQNKRVSCGFFEISCQAVISAALLQNG